MFAIIHFWVADRPRIVVGCTAMALLLLASWPNSCQAQTVQDADRSGGYGFYSTDFNLFQALSAQEPDRSGGAVIQRERIDTFIEDTARLDYRQAIDSLGRLGHEGYGLVQLAGLNSTPYPSIVMKQVLADRRVARIYEELSSKHENEAREIATKAFDEYLQQHQEEYAKFCNGTSEYGAYPSVFRHAASATLFLCASFGSPEMFLQKLDDWDDRLGRPKYDTGPRSSEHCRYADSLFTLNLFVLVAAKQGKRLEEMNARLNTLEAETGETLPRVEQLKFFKWNAHTNDTDFTHRTRGVPFDGNAIMTEVPGFSEGPGGQFGNNAEFTTFVLDAVRSWVEE